MIKKNKIVLTLIVLLTSSRSVFHPCQSVAKNFALFLQISGLKNSVFRNSSAVGIRCWPLFYAVISNPDVFCLREKSVKAQGGAQTDFLPKKTGSK